MYVQGCLLYYALDCASPSSMYRCSAMMNGIVEDDGDAVGCRDTDAHTGLICYYAVKAVKILSGESLFQKVLININDTFSMNLMG